MQSTDQPNCSGYYRCSHYSRTLLDDLLKSLYIIVYLLRAQKSKVTLPTFKVDMRHSVDVIPSLLLYQHLHIHQTLILVVYERARLFLRDTSVCRGLQQSLPRGWVLLVLKVLAV